MNGSAFSDEEAAWVRAAWVAGASYWQIATYCHRSIWSLKKWLRRQRLERRSQVRLSVVTRARALSMARADPTLPWSTIAYQLATPYDALKRYLRHVLGPRTREQWGDVQRQAHRSRVRPLPQPAIVPQNPTMRRACPVCRYRMGPGGHPQCSSMRKAG